MIKVKCDKYPKQKCHNLKNDFEKCIDCIHNLYTSLDNLEKRRIDNFNEIIGGCIMNQEIQAILNYCNELGIGVLSVDVVNKTFVVEQKNGTPTTCYFTEVPGIGEQYTATILIGRLIKEEGMLKTNILIKDILENFNKDDLSFVGYDELCCALYNHIQDNINLKSIEETIPVPKNIPVSKNTVPGSTRLFSSTKGNRGRII